MRELASKVADIVRVLGEFLMEKKWSPRSLYWVKKYSPVQIGNMFVKTHAKSSVVLERLARAAEEDDRTFDCKAELGKHLLMSMMDGADRSRRIGHYVKVVKGKRANESTYIITYHGSGHGGHDVEGGDSKGGIHARYTKYRQNFAKVQCPRDALAHEAAMYHHWRSGLKEVSRDWIVVGHDDPSSNYRLNADGGGISHKDLFRLMRRQDSDPLARDSMAGRVAGLAYGWHVLIETVDLVLGGILPPDDKLRGLCEALVRKGIDVRLGDGLQDDGRWTWVNGNRHLPIKFPRAKIHLSVSTTYLESFGRIDWSDLKQTAIVFTTQRIPPSHPDPGSHAITGFHTLPNDLPAPDRSMVLDAFCLSSGLFSGSAPRYEVLHDTVLQLALPVGDELQDAIDVQMGLIYGEDRDRSHAESGGTTVETDRALIIFWFTRRSSTTRPPVPNVSRRSSHHPLDPLPPRRFGQPQRSCEERPRREIGKEGVPGPTLLLVELEVLAVDRFGGLPVDGSGWNLVFKTDLCKRLGTLKAKDLPATEWIPLVALARTGRYWVGINGRGRRCWNECFDLRMRDPVAVVLAVPPPRQPQEQPQVDPAPPSSQAVRPQRAALGDNKREANADENGNAAASGSTVGSRPIVKVEPVKLNGPVFALPKVPRPRLAPAKTAQASPLQQSDRKKARIAVAENLDDSIVDADGPWPGDEDGEEEADDEIEDGSMPDLVGDREWNVASIICHDTSGKRGTPAKPWVLVSWEECPASQNSWEPVSAVHHTDGYVRYWMEHTGLPEPDAELPHDDPDSREFSILLRMEAIRREEEEQDGDEDEYGDLADEEPWRRDRRRLEAMTTTAEEQAEEPRKRERDMRLAVTTPYESDTTGFDRLYKREGRAAALGKEVIEPEGRVTVDDTDVLPRSIPLMFLHRNTLVYRWTAYARAF